MSQHQLMVATAFGLEAIVARELRGLGYEPEVVDLGRVMFEGDAEAICRTNLWLRSADRILVQLGQFPATDFGQLFDGTRKLPWPQWLPVHAEFPVTGRSHKSQLSSVPACQKIVKKAVVECLRAGHGVHLLDETGPRFPIHVALSKDVATLTIDTTGPSLHKRGYRPLVGQAPLKETLAAAIVQLSFWRPGRPLIDPFCGTGTIVIEAALIGRRMAPGLKREFAAEHWPVIPSSLWQEVRAQARQAVLPPLDVRILGTDTSEQALKMARRHAEQAGVAEDVHFQQQDFSQLHSKRTYGCVITNPPYGVRMGEAEDVRQLYESFPLVLRRLPTWSHYLLSATSQFEELLGRPADRRRKLYNGRIQCTLYQFYGPKPPSRAEAADGPEPPAEVGDEAAEPHGSGDSNVTPHRPAGGVAGGTEEARETAVPDAGEDRHQATVAADEIVPAAEAKKAVALKEASPPQQKPAFGGVSPKAREQAELFRRRLLKRARHLRRWPTRRGITCYRLYDRDIPEIPLAVDRYEDHLHIAEYVRPHDRSPAEHADWIDLMVRTAGQTLDVPTQKMFVKRRQRQRGQLQYERQQSQGPTLVVHEAGLQFQVNLSDYVDTGLFLDHRITRSLVRDAAAGKRFLNLFGYTGAFSVYAAAGGAASTITVDWSNTYLQWAEENMRLNGCRGPEHGYARADAFEFLHGRPRRPLFDLVVVDPPTYSNSKRTENDWDVQRDHAALLNELMPRVAVGGTVFFSTNFRRFKLDDAAIRGASIREISKQTVPEDFRNRRIHRCWRLVREEPD